MNDLSKLIDVVHAQKGELAFLQTLVLALLRSLSFEQRGEAIREFDKEVEAARSVLLYSVAPEEVLASFEHHVKNLNSLRVFPPGWRGSNPGGGEESP